MPAIIVRLPDNPARFQHISVLVLAVNNTEMKKEDHISSIHKRVSCPPTSTLEERLNSGASRY